MSHSPTELHAPTRRSAGDSMGFESEIALAFVATVDEPAGIPFVVAASGT